MFEGVSVKLFNQLLQKGNCGAKATLSVGIDLATWFWRPFEVGGCFGAYFAPRLSVPTASPYLPHLGAPREGMALGSPNRFPFSFGHPPPPPFKMG